MTQDTSPMRRIAQVALDKADRFTRDVRDAHSTGGLPAAARSAGLMVVGVTRRAGGYLVESVVDRRYGIRTRGIVHNGSDLGVRAVHADSTWYQATPLTVFRRVLRVCDLPRGETTFVDVGCGLGRVLVLAAEAGFGHVVGVELDTELAQGARRNAKAWADRHPGSAPDLIEVRSEDAAAMAFPSGPLLIYLYNPFGAGTLAEVARALTAQRDPRDPLIVFYANALHAQVLDREPGLTRIDAGRDWVAYRGTGPA